MSARRLFAYGTLMFPEVFGAVCRTRRAGVPATLAGYARYGVRGAAYPALVARSGATTGGVLLEDIDAALWPLLDAFEGALYTRIAVTVTRDSDAVPLEAQTYVATAACRRALVRTPWSAERFRDRDLARYLAAHD